MTRRPELGRVLAALFLGFVAYAAPAAAATAKAVISKEGQACLGCHEQQSPAFVKEWRISKHASKGVDCFTCHQREAGAVDAIDHYGYRVAIQRKGSGVVPQIRMDLGKMRLHARQ